MPVSQECLETGTEEPTRLETDGQPLFFFLCGAGQGVQHECSFCANAWTRARRATDRDLASVITDKKRNCEISVIFSGPNVF